jgi:hypothetical protein
MKVVRTFYASASPTYFDVMHAIIASQGDFYIQEICHVLIRTGAGA